MSSDWCSCANTKAKGLDMAPVTTQSDQLGYN